MFQGKVSAHPKASHEILMYRLCERFHKLPSEIKAQSVRDIRSLIMVLEVEHENEQRKEAKDAARKSRRVASSSRKGLR